MEDIYKYELPQYMDIDDLEVYCFTNKYAYNMCSHSNFWYSFFESYNLPIMTEHDNPRDWIDEFRIVQETMSITEKFRRHLSLGRTVTIKIKLNQLYSGYDLTFLPSILTDNDDKAEYLGLKFTMYMELGNAIKVSIEYNETDWDFIWENQYGTFVFIETIYFALYNQIDYELHVTV